MTNAELNKILTCVIDSEVAEQLARSYLQDAASFWRHVQEPSQRVSDRILLAKLAAIAIDRFDDKFIHAAAVVNLFYRSSEAEWCDVVDADALPALARQFKALLRPEAGFTECRWFLSLLLGEAAFWMSRSQFARAAEVLQEVEPMHDIAFRYGQLYTNVVKALLLRLVAGTRDCYQSESRTMLAGTADRTISLARQAPLHYIFSNEYAFEEVAYVYNMLRQVYNWRRLSDQVDGDLAELERAGFAWRCVGNPFRNFIG
jgi:hypothetical protein